MHIKGGNLKYGLRMPITIFIIIFKKPGLTKIINTH